ncbi:MAG: Mrp/NBP35 family ATP-binding protein [Candidatus Actinomarina sp.]|tara:strand:+ start:226 stop:1251 length:1026 start_codon:yes stop_codon:yes gene_type:complete
MELENIIYPGFNKSLSELKAISKIKKKSCEIVDLTEIEWVRDVLKHRIDEVGDFKIKFTKATEDEIQYVSNLVGADIDLEELKNSFHKNKRIIGITSGKGGVGKSTITSLLGIAFDSLGKKVGILDSDIWGYSVPKILGAKFPPIPFNERIFPSRINNLNVISMEYFVKQDEAVIWRGPMLHKAIEQFLFEVLWNDVDVLLIDMPPGTGDVSISLSQFLKYFENIVITTPQTNATIVAERSGIMSKKVNASIIGVIENMSYMEVDGNKIYPFGKDGGKDLSKKLDVPFLGELPLLEDITVSSEGSNLFAFKENAEFQNILNIANEILKFQPKKKPIDLKIN